MRKLASSLVGAFALIALAACSDQQLTVTNQQAPDQARALARPTDVEGLVGSAFRTIHQATEGDILTGVLSQMLSYGMESYSTLANAGMGPAGAIPRNGVDNSRGNQTLNEKYNPYLNIYRAARSAALGLSKLNAPGFTFFPTSIPQVKRDQAFAWFVIGVALGDISMVWDSGAVVNPSDDPQAMLPFVQYDSLNKVALAYMDSAIAYAAGGNATGGFPLPSAWINGDALTYAQFVALCHSWKARLRAGMARTPTERAAVNWAAVIADAKAGYPTDFTITMVNGSPAWSYEPLQMDLYQQWHQMWQYWIGMADTSGAYNTYLATTPIVQRALFLIQTPDGRFPSGGTRAAQNTSSGCGGSGCLPSTANMFFRNRLAGADTPGDPLGFSEYDFDRFQTFYNANRNGNIPTFTRAELNLLIAEGHIVLGDNLAEALQYIDSSRVKRGLHALTGVVTALTDLVPGQDGVKGSNSCVPRIPVSPFTTTACGNVLEAMKWEKRMETAFTHWGAWWIDGRGWGDLPNLTPLQYPVPYQELDTRLKTGYTYTSTYRAGPGKYGL